MIYHICDSDALARRVKDLCKTYKPVSPDICHLRCPLNPHIYKGRPVRSLTVAQRRKIGGRNQLGVITFRHRDGGHKQRIRILDYKHEAPGIHDVVRIEYDLVVQPTLPSYITVTQILLVNKNGVTSWLWRD